MQHVLLVQSDPDLATILARSLSIDGLEVRTVATGRDAVAQAELVTIDLILLDGNIPDEDATATCAALRRSGFGGGLVLLSSRDSEIDRVSGLDAGADDYLGKPCGLAELRASVRAVLRRVARGVEESHTLEGLMVDATHSTATYHGSPVPLTELEHLILLTLIQERSRVVTHRRLAQRAWPDSADVTSASMSVAIGRLRNKLNEALVPHQIDTLRAVGYRLRPPSETASV